MPTDATTPLEPAGPRLRPPGRPTVGVLYALADDRYENAIFAGMAAAARDCDVNLLQFVGEILTYNYPRAEYATPSRPCRWTRPG